MPEPLTSLLETLPCSLTTLGKQLCSLYHPVALTDSFPSHYIENVGTEDLIWIEIYKAEKVADISLTQWLALTPSDIVANVLNVPIEFAKDLKKEKQVLLSSEEQKPHNK